MIISLTLRFIQSLIETETAVKLGEEQPNFANEVRL